jgi:nicotinamidase-related amidase
MSTQGDRTALVVIDVQNAVVENAWDRDGVVSRIATLIGRARDEQVPVVFVQHENDPEERGTHGWQFVDAVAPRAGDIVIAKQYPDAFVETDLAATLEDLDVGHLVIAGAQTDGCIRATFHRSLVEGYDVTLVADCHTTDDRALEGVTTITGEQIVAHTNMYVPYTLYPGQASSISSHDDVPLSTAEAVIADV